MADENYSYAPKYVQIQNYILQKIESGEYAAGDKIPSEIELARQFDVSRLTVNTAVKELANSGIVERVQGKGTFVRFVPGQSFSSPMAFSGGIKIAPFEHSNNKPHRLLEHGVIKADAALCQKLGLTAENPYVYKIVRCVDVSSEVDEVDYSYVPLSVCKDHTFDCEALKTFFLHDYICRYFNEKPTHIRIFVDTPLTSDMELSLLNAPPEKLFSWDISRESGAGGHHHGLHAQGEPSLHHAGILSVFSPKKQNKYPEAAAQCAVRQPFLRGDGSIRFGTELRGRSALFLQKRDCFWHNREFSTNKLGLLTIYNRGHHGYTYVRLISCLYI